MEEEGEFEIFLNDIFLNPYPLIAGVQMAEQDRIIEAIECFTRAIELDPHQPSAFNNRAQAYQLQNQREGKFRRTNTRNISFIVS